MGYHPGHGWPSKTDLRTNFLIPPFSPPNPFFQSSFVVLEDLQDVYSWIPLSLSFLLLLLLLVLEEQSMQGASVCSWYKWANWGPDREGNLVEIRVQDSRLSWIFVLLSLIFILKLPEISMGVYGWFWNLLDVWLSPNDFTSSCRTVVTSDSQHHCEVLKCCLQSQQHMLKDSVGKGIQTGWKLDDVQHDDQVHEHVS